MGFMDKMKNQLSQAKILTENGAVAYASTGKALGDLAFAITHLRGANESEIRMMFENAFYADTLNAMRELFWIRDCRGGLGERRIFSESISWLTEIRPDIVRATLRLFPEYGRWKDLWPLLDTSLRSDVISLVKETIQSDSEAIAHGKPATLLFKWLPSNVASSDETKHYAEIIRQSLGMSPRDYRKMLSRGRAYLDIVERKISANEWDEVDYEAVPSKANLLYKDAFLRHDRIRRGKYLESLQKGEAKINASVLYPHEIVERYMNNGGWGTRVKKEDDSALEELWKALPDVTVGNTLVVCDTSGSMTITSYGSSVRPIDVATALSVYMSEHNDGEWKDKILSFSMNPKIIDFSGCRSLREKVKRVFDNAEISNTDIEKTMLLILHTAVENDCTQKEMPGTVLILSDCEFDEMTHIRGKSLSASLFDNIASEFETHGYKMPKIVFWNLSGGISKIPMQQNDLGVCLCSGFSVQLMNMAMSSKTDPYEALLETINNPRYDAVETSLKGIL